KNGATTPFATGRGQDFTFTPDDNGSYVATVTVSDGNGLSVTGSPVAVTASNVAPIGDPGGNQTVNEGDQVHLLALVADPGSADRFYYQWHVVASNGQQITDGD